MKNWIVISADGDVRTMRIDVRGRGIVFPKRHPGCTCFVGRYFRRTADGVLREVHTDLMGLLERHERLKEEELSDP